ncbi:hypothetical protein SASPL_134502 [Salvia splendens]|uniref:Peptidase S8 n=2 Tax=Salvia splendens TaxID=180675 RepID=A0A8X8ZJH2_SALSN|nr:hypothetical protein SASPL_134502 [Salvia splendens]
MMSPSLKMAFPNSAVQLLLSLFLLVHHVSSQRSTYIVHMDKSSMPNPFSSHHFWYSSLLTSSKSTSQTCANADKSEPKLIYTYDHAFHGFSAVLSADEVEALKNSAGFISAYKDSVVTPDTIHSTNFLGLTSASGLWPASNYGKDGACNGGEDFNSSLCNKKIIGARYFNQGGRAENPDREFKDSARDDDGHGTHVASIAAGNIVLFFGAAESDMLAGMDQAVADGVDIISVSISSRAEDLYESPFAIASFGAREKGIMVCTSAGNRGTRGVRTIFKGVPWAVVVASGTVDCWFAGTLTLGNGKTITGWTTFPARANIRNLQLVYNQTSSACDSPVFFTEAPSDSIFICNLNTGNADLGTVMLYQPGTNVLASIVITSTTAEIFRSTSLPEPGVVITPEEGEEVMAPGVLILAAFHPQLMATRIGRNIDLSSDYNLISGTSMACPHVSGIAALLKAAHPDWGPAAIQSAMMTTANPLDSNKQPIKDLEASPLGIGSGHVDPDRALDPGLVYDASVQDLVNLKMEFPNAVFHLLFSLLFLLVHHVSSQRSTYIVHMDKSTMPKAFSSHHFWYSSLLTSSKRSVSEPKLIYTYDHAFHGFSAVLSEDELEALKNSAGFISAYKDGVVMPDTTHSSKFLGLTSASGLWPASSYGKDIIIGIVDSGIWPESPSFSDDGMTEIPARWKGACNGGEGFNASLCNRKIIGARYFNQGIRAEDPDQEFKDSARDDTGHGTHVASIAAGNIVEGVSFFGYAPGTARGVAPRARLAVYKVLFRGATESDLLAGMDQAIADGVDIISVSISSRANNLYESPFAIAGFGAREKGIMLVTSAGNRGTRGIRTIFKGVPWAVVVASGTVDRWFAGTLTLGNGKTITGWTTYPATAILRNVPVVYNQSLTGCTTAELAEAPENTIIVCNTTIGNTNFDIVMEDLSNSNVKAAIIIAEETSIFRFSTFPYPGVVITAAQGQQVADYALASATPTASIDFQQTILGRGPRAAPALSDDSSRGPGRSYEGILKPDLMAPGVLILAAFQPHFPAARIGRNIDLSADYNLLSGTSMACPHISGVLALLKAAHPDWSLAAIQSAMMTTANPLDNTNQPIRAQDGSVASPLGIGSGHVDPNRALDPGLIYDASMQDLVNLVCSMNFTRNQTLTIIRSSYNCTNPSSDLNYPSFVALIRAAEMGRTLTRRFRRRVTNVGNGAATYKVTVEVPVNTTAVVRPQTLVFGKKYETKSYSLTIRYKADIEIQHREGAVIWTDQTGKYRVRSPIMVSAAADNFE